MTDQPPVPANQPSSEEMKRAMQAFKKRLKVLKLDEESSLGHGPTSSGRKSSIVAIQPPRQFPQAVWDALVQSGKLKYSGHGLYELVKH
jgi:hypothetical protein